MLVCNVIFGWCSLFTVWCTATDATSNGSQSIAQSASHDLPVWRAHVQSVGPRGMHGAMDSLARIITSVAVCFEGKRGIVEMANITKKNLSLVSLVVL